MNAEDAESAERAEKIKVILPSMCSVSSALSALTLFWRLGGSFPSGLAIGSYAERGVSAFGMGLVAI